MDATSESARRGLWSLCRLKHARPRSGQREQPDDLDRVIGAIATGSGEIGVELVDVAGNVDAVSEQVAEQVRMFGDLGSDAAGMRVDNREVAAAAAAAQEATHQVTVRVHQSQEMLQSSLGGLNDLTSWVESAGDQMQDLAQRADGVGSIARQVEAIARRTHVLALNAGIEAARSGQSGKGFSAIADSVRQLADQSIEAASDIDSTLGQLAAQIRVLSNDGSRARDMAAAAQRDVRAIDETIRSVDAAMSSIDRQAAGIAQATLLSGEKVDRLVDSLASLVVGVEHSSLELDTARGRVNSLLGQLERLIGLTAQTNFATVDTPFVEVAQRTAGEVSALFAEGLATGRVTADQLFSSEYQPIPGTDPEQFMAAFTGFADDVIRPHLDSARETVPGIRFVVIANLDGYVPVHHPDYSQPQGDDPVWNDAHCRNRRFFLGRTEITGARNSQPFLLQTYRRPMGGNTFSLMKDVAAPIMVTGRQWGGLRIGYVTARQS
jgi:methyl-accepting chemotaxis protein